MSSGLEASEDISDNVVVASVANDVTLAATDSETQLTSQYFYSQ